MDVNESTLHAPGALETEEVDKGSKSGDGAGEMTVVGQQGTDAAIGEGNVQGDEGEEAGGEHEDEEDEEEIVPAVKSRERRANAGNRMRALIDQEVEAEEMFAEEEDDVDFVGKDEEDIFDSDFGSTSSGEDDDDEEAGEKELVRQDKEARKAARMKAPSQAVMHALKPRKPFFAPSSVVPAESTPKEPPAKKRKVSLGGAIILDDDYRRSSTRKAALQFKQDVESRAKEAENRRASFAKPKPKMERSLTQAELIEEALQTEEANRAKLKKFHEDEEERMEKLRLYGDRSMTGPVLRFWSRMEEYRDDKGEGGALDQSLITAVDPTSQNVTPAPPSKEPTASLPPPADIVSAEGPAETKDQPSSRHSRNYVVLDNVQGNRTAQMEALFGDHADWAHMRVIPTRNRLVNRRVAICPLTGLPAPYRDPHTGIPYANVRAYKKLKRLLDHDFVWDAHLMAYTGEIGQGMFAQMGPGYERTRTTTDEIVEQPPTATKGKGRKSLPKSGPVDVVDTPEASSRKRAA